MKGRKTVPAAEFKAKCLGLLDQVAKNREVIVVTKRGVPVAQLAPLPQTQPAPFRNSVAVRGDIVAPLDEAWEADR